MRKVIIESPFAGDVERNIEYARECMYDCLLRGEAPLASHLLYTQPGILDDTIPEERELGIEAGLVWAAEADATVVYGDYGFTDGMIAGIGRAVKEGRPVELRTIKEIHDNSTHVMLEHTHSFIHSHSETECLGDRCTLHKRSDHHMRHMPQNWRHDRKLMERICEHGVGHPDPDEINLDQNGRGVHGCDGCCRKPE